MLPSFQKMGVSIGKAMIMTIQAQSDSRLMKITTDKTRSQVLELTTVCHAQLCGYGPTLWDWVKKSKFRSISKVYIVSIDINENI